MLGVVYSAADPAPGGSDTRVGLHFGAGRVEYDRSTNTLTIVAPGGVTLSADVQIGGGASPLALADKVATVLQELVTAISGAAVAPTDGGAAFKAALLAALAGWPGDLASEVARSD